MMNTIKWLSLLCVLVLFSSCKALKKTKGAEEVTALSLHRTLIQNQIQADWMTARVKASMGDGGLMQSATAEIRMKSDSVIWMSVRKIGFEIARALVTKDSVFLVDRFNKQYAAEDLTFLSELYNLPASFQAMEAILMGNPVFFTLTDFSLDQTEENYILSSNGKINAQYQVNKTDFKIAQMQFEQAAAEQLVSIDFDRYQLVDGKQEFSYLRTINAAEESLGDVKITLDFSKVEFNQPKTIRFEIPSNYTKME